MQSEKPICRFCFASSSTKQNPLIEPCECRGSIRFVHQHCLNRWRKMDPARNAQLCLLCLEPYRLEGFVSYEIIPSQARILILLRYPMLLCLVVNYLAFFQYSLGHPSVSIYSLLELYQYIFQLLYLGLFCFHWNVQQKRAYWQEVKGKGLIVFSGLYIISNYALHQHQFFALLPINYILAIAWHRHIQILEMLNQD
jgi:E3 ubiquitin-protein ligase DOA10